MAEAKPRLQNRASFIAQPGDVCTVVLVDANKRPMMNLHKVPLHVCVLDIKTKVSDRLKEVGRSLAADLMILCYGEESEEEMEDSRPLSSYNTMGLSKVIVSITKRYKFDITIVAKTTAVKCLCISKKPAEEYSFDVRVPYGLYVKQLRAEVARRMNCNVDRHTITLFMDPQMEEAIPVEGTMRAHGISHKTKLYIVAPPNFDINGLASLEIERPKKGDNPQEVKAEEVKEDILTETTDADDKAEAKTPIQLEFEKKAGKSKTLGQDQVAELARKLGYSPSVAEVAALPPGIDYKTFQNFLTAALHAEDSAEAFKNFFSLFDTQGSGDLSSKQLCNILQMYGDEPLTKEEAERVTKIVMAGEKQLPIMVVVDRLTEGQI